MRLVTDPCFRLRVLAHRLGIEGILAGTGGPWLVFAPAPTGDDRAKGLRAGDELLVSRASTLCSVPAVVGVVREVDRPAGEAGFEAVVVPAVAIARLTRVEVIESETSAEGRREAGPRDDPPHGLTLPRRGAPARDPGAHGPRRPRARPRDPRPRVRGAEDRSRLGVSLGRVLRLPADAPAGTPFGLAAARLALVAAAMGTLRTQLDTGTLAVRALAVIGAGSPRRRSARSCSRRAQARSRFSRSSGAGPSSPSRAPRSCRSSGRRSRC